MHGIPCICEMTTEFRGLLVERLRAERARLGLSQAEMAERGGTKMRTYQDWERGVATVATEFLLAMGAHGLDVVYVLTGKREATLGLIPADESALLDNYRAADAAGQASLQAAGAAFAQQGRPGVAKPRKASGGE